MITEINLDHLNKVFVAVGFLKWDPNKIWTALEHTDSLLWMEYRKMKWSVAFVRSTGDGLQFKNPSDATLASTWRHTGRSMPLSILG
ncbi:hypothetical protein ACFX15_034656 [Malus domestica]